MVACIDAAECVVVEYKCRMELTAETAANIYRLESGTHDRFQLRLNMWMLYLCTGIWPSCGYIVQATRRITKEDILGPQQAAAIRGVVAKLPTETAGPEMVRLITRFAIHPFGPESVGRYCDGKILVPSLTRLMIALRLKVGKTLEYDVHGRSVLFVQVLQNCKFSIAVDSAIGYSNLGDSASRRRCHLDNANIHIGLPEHCFTPSPNGTKPGVWNDFRTSDAIIDASYAMRREWKAKIASGITVGPSKYINPAHSLLHRAGYLPILFDSNGMGLLFCNTTLDIQVFCVNTVGIPSVRAARASQSAFSTVSALPLFRNPQPVRFGRRLRFGNDVQPTRLALHG